MNVLTFEDFRLASYQATLFTPDEEVSSVKLIKGLLPRWTERFDAEPTIVPAMEGIPREVPRLILQSKSEDWRCEIASARINLFWRKPKADAPEPTLAQFFAEATRLLNEYREFLGARVGRIAAVLKRYAQHPSPGLFLAKHFCRESWLTRPLNRPEHFELHAHKRFSLAGRFDVNSWVRSKTGKLSPGTVLLPQKGRPSWGVVPDSQVSGIVSELNTERLLQGFQVMCNLILEQFSFLPFLLIPLWEGLQPWQPESQALTTIEDISSEAERRFRGHEKVVQEVLSLAEKEARARGISLVKIDVRPAWSHEYEERTGVVIDVEIKATAEERFSYWDAVCEWLDQLADSLPPKEQRFLNDEISFIVNRS